MVNFRTNTSMFCRFVFRIALLDEVLCRNIVYDPFVVLFYRMLLAAVLSLAQSSLSSSDFLIVVRRLWLVRELRQQSFGHIGRAVFVNGSVNCSRIEAWDEYFPGCFERR